MPLVLPAPATALILARLLSCTAGEPPVLHLHYLARPPVFFSDSTTAELRQRAPNMANLISPEDFPITSGLTESKLETSVSIGFGRREVDAGQFCVWPQDVVLDVTYRSQVSIAKEYQQNSCRYGATKLHEMRHVKADEDTLQEFLPEIEKKLTGDIRTMRSEGPLDRRDVDAAQDQLLGEVQKMVAASLDKIENIRALRQRAIDTPAEYQRLSDACPSERP